MNAAQRNANRLEPAWVILSGVDPLQASDTRSSNLNEILFFDSVTGLAMIDISAIRPRISSP